MADICRPGAAGELHVVRTSEGVGLGGGECGPRATEASRSPGAEVPVPRASDTLHNEKVLVADLVHIRCLEQVVWSRRGSNHRIAESAREVGYGRGRTVQVAVIVGREEVAVGRVANDPHVHPVPAADVLSDNARLAAEEVRGGSPGSRVRDVGVGGVCSVSVLEDEIPLVLRRVMEHLGGSAIATSNGSRAEVMESRALCICKVCESQVCKLERPVS